MTIYLMRHGEPTYKDVRAMGLIGQGAELGQLTPLGMQQAAEAAKDPRIQDVDLIVASPYPRALHTAAIVSRTIDAPLEVAPGIFEWLQTTDYSDLRSQDIYDSWDEFKRNGGVHKPDDEHPLWETYAEMRARIIPWILPYLERNDIKKLLIVCHGGVMRALIKEPSRPVIDFCEIMEYDPALLRDADDSV